MYTIMSPAMHPTPAQLERTRRALNRSAPYATAEPCEIQKSLIIGTLQLKIGHENRGIRKLNVPQIPNCGLKNRVHAHCQNSRAPDFGRAKLPPSRLAQRSAPRE